MHVSRLFASAALLMASGLGPSPAQAAVVNETEPNNAIAQADDIDPHFSTDFTSGIEDAFGNNTSTIIPHVSYASTFTPGPQTADYFRFTVPGAGSHAVFDVDSASFQSDTKLFLFDQNGNLLAENDNHTQIDNGSETLSDPFLEYTFAAAGIYVVGMGRGGSTALNGVISEGLRPIDSYVVHASLNAVPEPASILLFGAGTAGLIYTRRRSARKSAAAVSVAEPVS